MKCYEFFSSTMYPVFQRKCMLLRKVISLQILETFTISLLHFWGLDLGLSLSKLGSRHCHSKHNQVHTQVHHQDLKTRTQTQTRLSGHQLGNNIFFSFQFPLSFLPPLKPIPFLSSQLLTQIQTTQQLSNPCPNLNPTQSSKP